MCRQNTDRPETGRQIGKCAKWLLVLAIPAPLCAQNRLDWRRIGTPALDLHLASLASGPVVRAWYSVDGSRLSVRTANGRTFETADFSHWTETPDASAPGEEAPEPVVNQPV